MPDWSDIEADVHFLATSEGGRKGFAASGYRPQFYHHGQDWVAVIETRGHINMLPGCDYSVSICFMSPHLIIQRLRLGDEFAIREGSRTVATGVVTRIVDLEKSAEKLLAANHAT